MNTTRRAFTLLELLLAMTIVVMLAAALFASLRTAFMTKDSTEKSLAADRSADLVMEVIRNDIQSALPPGRGKLQQAFEGKQNPMGNGCDDVEFFTTAPASMHSSNGLYAVNGVPLGNGDIKQIEITATQLPGSPDNVLVRRTWNNLLDPNIVQAEQQNPTQAPPIQFGDEEVLCRHVHSLTFQYCYGTTWQQTWDSTASSPVNVLPTAIWVTLQIQAADSNPANPPRFITYDRIFQLPCNGQSNDSASTTSTGNSGGAG